MIAIKQTWPEDEILIYLCSFYVLKNWENHIWTNIHNLGTLKDLVNKQLYYFIYIPIEYNENEEYFLKRVRTIKKNLFKFLYVDKMRQFIEMYYKHQGKFSLLSLIFLNFKSHIFICLNMYFLSFYHNLY